MVGGYKSILKTRPIKRLRQDRTTKKSTGRKHGIERHERDDELAAKRRGLVERMKPKDG